MRRFYQHALFSRRTAAGVARPGQWCPQYSTRYAFDVGGKVLLVEYRPWRGFDALALYVPVLSGYQQTMEFSDWSNEKMKKRSLGMGEGEKLPALSGESVVLKRFPRVREFLTAIYYDDGSARSTGVIWLKTDSLAFAVTLLDPDACARITARAQSIDDALTLAEKLLDAENAPWELDRYAAERAMKGKKKK
jgi:hypothetical protein